jgi:Cell morphogenesis N-terminal
MFAEIMTIPIDVELDIPTIFGPGANPAFDKVLSSLGHIGSHKPTPVINTVMYWRAHKVKIEGGSDGTAGGRGFAPTPANVPAGAAAAITAGTNPSPAMVPLSALPPSVTQSTVSGPPALLRRQTEPVSVNTAQGQELPGQYTSQRATMVHTILRDRQKNCTVYILCRALIEVIKNTTYDALNDDVASRIEPIVFRELISQVPENYYGGKAANWNIFAELLGCFSSIRYLPSMFSLCQIFICQ